MPTATEARAAALAAFNGAPPGADWKAIAAMLADAIPKPRAKPESGPEWCEYTQAQHRGRGKVFRANISALFEFAGRQMIAAPLRHRCDKPAPDWARAARFAVRFYRLNLARELLDLTGRDWGNVRQSQEEIYAAGCQVPEFTDALDESRNVRPDLGKLNAATSDLRSGREFMKGIEGPDLRQATLTALYGDIWRWSPGERDAIAA